MLKVEKRDGQIVDFDKNKIELAITEAAKLANKSEEYVKKLINLIDPICEEITSRFTSSEFMPNVENISDIVEKHLMIANEFEVAKMYILTRADRNRKDQENKRKTLRKMTVKKSDGRVVVFNPNKIKESIARCADGLEDINVNWVFDECIKYIYDGIQTNEIDKVLVLAATPFIEKEPNYNYLAARLYQQKLRKEVFGYSTIRGSKDAEKSYKESFIYSIKFGVKKNVIDERLLDFDLKKLSEHIRVERDNLFKHLGIQTLYERYFTKFNGVLLELPQSFWMRVAMGLAINEKNKEEAAIEFYNVMSTFMYVPSTPTLFHSGLTHPQLSSCYLTCVDDDLKDIFKNFSDNSQLSKWSGGVANDWTNIRSIGSFINSTKVDSQGTVPFLKISNDTTVAINRSGKRRGATVAYLEVWHMDFEDFLDLKKNTGDERRRAHDMNTATWIPDLFMKRVKANKTWTLFSPDEVPDLHDLYGKAFDEAYEKYEMMAQQGAIKRFKVMDAEKLFKRIIGALFDTGNCWPCFKDPANIRSPQDHVGVVHSSNLCCVAGDQRAVTDRGILTVKELYDLKGKNIIAGKNDIENATEMFLPRPNAPMVKIITKEGYNHKVTPDHKVWVLDKGEVEAQNLVSGDLISIQQTFNLWGNVNKPEEAFICGLIAGDGTFGNNNVCIDVWEKDFFIIPRVEEYVSNLIKKYNYLNFDHASYKDPKFNSSKDGKKQRLTSSALYVILKEIGFDKESKLKIPDFVWKGNKETVSSYLEGLYLADATTEAGEVTTTSLASTNRKLLEDVQIILANFGVKSSICLIEESGWRKMPDGNGGEKEYYCETRWRLLTTSIKSSKIIESITSIGKYRNNTLFLENLKKDGYEQKMHCTFEKLEILSNEDAYCLTVNNEDHLWTVNGILTKNTEILLNTKPSKLLHEKIDLEKAQYERKYDIGEVAVCVIGSLVLSSHIVNKSVNFALLKSTVATAMRMLDNVIELNYCPIPEAFWSNYNHRPVGLGVMGMQDALFQMDLSFEDPAVEEFVDSVQEWISYCAIEASCDMAKIRGAYKSYKGSKWSKGIFPLDTMNLLEEERGIPINVSRKTRCNWAILKQKVADYGMRNSLTQAIAPTATISNIVGCYPCIEPQYKNIYVKSNMSGEFTIINEYLVKDLKQLGLWNEEMVNDIKYHDGSIQNIPSIPQNIKNKYKEVFEIDQKKLIDLTALRAKWIDQSQSHNIFYRGKSGKEVSEIYFYAWEKGLKTTYYLRTLGASQIEKSTLDASKYGLTQKREVKVEEQPKEIKLCKLDNPDCEACQ